MTIVLVLYMVALMAIAVRSTRNIKSIPDFFVARKGASTLAVAGSLVATILGGSAIIGAIDTGSKMGGAAAWFMLSGAIGLLALLPLTQRAYALGRYSLPDLIENMYGKGPRLVASFVIPLAWIGIVAAQIIASAKLLQSFTSLNYNAAALISAAIFILYTIAGGQYSILRTDFLQALLIIAGLATIVVCTFCNTPDLVVHSSALNTAPGFALNTAPAFPFNANFAPLDLLLLLLTYGTTFTAGPDMFSRIFCARDAKTARKAIFAAALVLIPVAATIGYLAAFGVRFEGVPGARITSIAQSVVPAPLLPLIALSLLSVVLSSADTTLLSSSVIICGLFRKKESGEQNESKPLFKARLVILVNGCIATLLALHFTDIIGTLLLALAVYAGAFTVPVLWGLAGMRSKPIFVNLAIIAGGLLALAGKLIPATTGHTKDAILIAAFVVNALLLTCGKIKKT